MRVLGLDTSTRSGSVAVVEAGRLRGELNVSGPLDHSERLLPSVELLLGRLGLRPSQVDAIAVTRGPGSFTGVRVGLATARGLARSAGVLAAGVGTLEALAHTDEDLPPAGTWICPWIDAGRGEVYAAAYAVGPGGLEERLAPAVESPARWLGRLPDVAARFLGDGAEAYRDLLLARAGGGAPRRRGPWFLARWAALLVARRLPGGALEPPEPLYLRPSDAQVGRRP